jgi:hypothetical protein
VGMLVVDRVGRRPVERVEVEDPARRPGPPAVSGDDKAPAALWIDRITGGVGSPGSGGCRPVPQQGESGARRGLIGGAAVLEVVLEQHECTDQAEGTVNGALWGVRVSRAPEHTFVS